MLNKMTKAIAQYNMLNKGANVLVALSGGADSVALLLGLIAIRDKYELKISAIHINHNLRGEESLRDENFVIELCDKLNIPLIIESADINDLSKETKQSVELCARNVRYEMFKKHSVDKIATAHTANDNAETVIYNLTRGAGIRGISGIPPVRDNIIRPLINVTRDEILDFLDDNNASFVTDSTNNEDIYIRNKIRHNIIPKLRSINPNVFDSISNLSNSAREDSQYLDEIANLQARKLISNNVLDIKIAKLNTAIIKRILVIYYNSFNIFCESLSSLQINEMLRVVKGEIKRTSLDDDYVFNSIKNGFIIEKQIKDAPKIYSSVNINDIESLKSYFINAVCVSYEEYVNFLKNDKLLFKYAIDCDKIKGKVFIRSREDGDRYSPVSRNVTKSLRKLLTESKLSLLEKSQLKILCDNDGIFYTNLFGIDERVKPDNNSKKIIICKD